MRRWTGKVVVAVLTIAVSWGGWQLLPASSPQSPAPNIMPLPPAEVRLASVAVVPSFAKHATQPAKAQPQIATESRAREATEAAPTVSAIPTTRDAANTAAEESDSISTAGLTELVSAKATTWVNVRAEANGTSAIVGIILPDSIVELGESLRGWRRVSTRSLSGWASAKLFTVDSLKR